MGCSEDIWCGMVFAGGNLIPLYASASVCVRGEMRESFGDSMGVRQVCDVTMGF